MKKIYSHEGFGPQNKSSGNLFGISTMSSDPELMRIRKSISTDSIQSSEGMSAKRKKNAKKIGRSGSTSPKKPGRPAEAFERPKSRSSTLGAVPTEALRISDESNSAAAVHPSSKPNEEFLQQRARKSSLMLGGVARRLANREPDGKPTMIEEQKVDWEHRAGLVAQVMFMSNAELSKGIRPLEKDEVEEVADMFGLFDMDKNGTLDDLELGSLVRALGFKVNNQQIHRVLRWLDTDVDADRRRCEKGKSIMQMLEEKAVDFDSFVQLMLRLRADGPPKLDRKLHHPEVVDSKGKPIKQTLVLFDALERVLPYKGETWPPDGVNKKKLKDVEITGKACDVLIELCKQLIKEREMLESLQNDLMIFKAQLQARNRKGVQEISNVGGEHQKLKTDHALLTKDVQSAQEQLAEEKEKYSVLHRSAVPELAELDAEVISLRKKVEGWEQRVREDSLCARDLVELQKAKEARIRELAPKVHQCSELQKKCQASSQVNVVLKSLLLECCANFDAFVSKKEAPLQHLESRGLQVQKCVQGLLEDHTRINKSFVATPDGVPDPAIPVISGVGAAS